MPRVPSRWPLAAACGLLVLLVVTLLASGWLAEPGASADVDRLTVEAGAAAARAAPLQPASSTAPSGTPLPVVAGLAEDVAPLVASAPKADRLALVGRPLLVRGRLADELGAPIAGASITFVPSGVTRAASGLESRDWALPLERFPRAASDADGHFEIAGAVVRRGTAPDSGQANTQGTTYLLIAAEGFVDLTPTVPAPEELLARPEPILPVDLGELRPHREGRLIGRVVDSHGRPLEGARIRIASAATHGDDVVGAPYRYLASKPDLFSGPDGRFEGGGCWTHRRRLSIGIAGQQERRLDVELVLGETRDLGDIVLAVDGRLAGRVVDGSGRPFPGAEVLVRRPGPALDQGNEHYDRVTLAVLEGDGRLATTDAAGRFAVDRLHGSLQDVFASAPWHETAVVEGVLTDSDDLVLPLLPGARVLLGILDAETGRVVDEATVEGFRRLSPGTLARWHPTPIAVGAELRELLERFPLPASLHRDGDMPADADCVLAELARDTESAFVVRAPGYQPVRVELPGLDPGGARTRVVRLRRAARVEGVVVDPSGAPVPDARVVCRVDAKRPDFGPWSDTTDAAGRFAFSDLPAGDVLLGPAGVLPPGLAAPAPLALRTRTGVTERGLRLQLQAAASLTVQLLDAGGLPRAGVRVSIASGAGHSGRGLSSDADGRCHFSALPAGPWTAKAEKTKGTLQLLPGEQGELTLRAPPDVRLSGRVVERGTGRPVAGVRVSQAAWDGIFDPWQVFGESQTDTDADGRFVLDRSQLLGWHGPDELQLFTQVPGGQVVGQLDLDFPLDEGRDGLLVEIGGARLSARIVDELTGAPVPGARLRVGRPNLTLFIGSSVSQYKDAIADAEGRIELDWLEPGEWELQVSATGYPPRWLPAEFAPGDNALTLRARPAAVLEGLAVHEGGEALWDGTRVRLSWQGAAEDSGQRSFEVGVQDGRFRFDGLMPGPWELRCIGDTLDARAVLADHPGRILELAPGTTTRVELVLLKDV